MTTKTKLTLSIGAVIGAAILAWLAFGVFGIHTAFIDDTVNEENPFATQTIETATVDGDDAAASQPAAPSSDEPAAADGATSSEEPAEQPEPAEQAEPAKQTEPVEPAVQTEPAEPAEQAAPQIVTIASGSLIDHDHSGTGTANVLTDGNQTFLRFEDDFAVDNGPDLNVYLVRGVDAEGPTSEFDDDFIDLGDLKGNIGAQNYELPAGVDVSEYDTVVIWCVRFGVAFNAADLA